MTCPRELRAWTSNTLKSPFTFMRVSNPDFAARATAVRWSSLGPARTFQDETSVAPFQLA